MAFEGDKELIPLHEDFYDIDLRSVSYYIEETRLSLFPQFYPVVFSHNLRGAGMAKHDKFSSVVVKLPDPEAEQKLSSIKFAVTKLTLDKKGHMIKAENTSRQSEGLAVKWTQDVLSEISKQGLGVYSYAVVHVGLQAEAIQKQIKTKFAGVFCELNEKHLTLLLYSENRDRVKIARELAEKARPSIIFSNEFVTPAGINISLRHQDITQVPTDGVVSAVDEDISFSGGVSLAIHNVVGAEMKKECKEFRRSQKKLQVTEIFATSGEPRWRKVLHAHGPQWGTCSAEQCGQQLTETIYNCFKKAKELGLTSLAVPFVSSQTFAVPSEVCAQSYKTAIEMFDRDVQKSQSSLKKIMFVDTAQERVESIRGILSQDLQRANTLRLVIVGKTGVGKSSLGNRLLGKKDAFFVKKSWAAVTVVSAMDSVEKLGVSIEVVDSPGLFDKDDAQHEQNMMKEVLKTVVFALPGPHAFLLVFRADTRFDKSEEDVCSAFKSLFSDPSDKNNLLRFIIVVITHVESDDDLKELKETAPPSVKSLLKDCSGRIVGVNNRNPLDQSHDIDKLIQMALALREQNEEQQAYFSNDLIERCLQLLQSDEYKDKSLDEIKKEIQKGAGEQAMAKVINDPQARKGAEDTQKKCVIL